MKIFNKVVALIVSAVMLMSSVAYAATSSRSINQENEKLTVTIDCGTTYNGQTLSVTILKPASGGLGDLSADDYTETNVDSVISYASQHVVSDGKIVITYKPDPQDNNRYGVYTVRVAGENAGTVEYKTDIDKANIVAELKAAPGNVSVVASLFAPTANANVYTKAQRIDLDLNAQFYSAFVAASPEVKDKVYANIANRIDASLTLASLTTLFDEAVYVCILDSKEDDAILSYIDTNKTYSGIDTASTYTGIREDPAKFTSAVQTSALDLIEETDLSTMTKAQANAEVEKALLNALLSNCSLHGVLFTEANTYSAIITAAGGNMTGFTLSHANTLRNLRPFANLAKFVEELNKLTGSTTTPSNPSINVDQPSFPAGNGGSAGGGNVSFSRPTPNTDIFADNGTVGSTPASTTFTDLKGYEWAENAIKALKDKNIIGGKSATEFAPADTVLREEFAKMIMLAVLSGKVQSVTEASFTDVDANAWYAPYIEAATKNGVINGYGSTFGLGDTIRREDMAVMCYRAIKAAGITLNAEREAHKFTDAISDYAQDAIAAMYAAGLINGYSETEFNANGTATRAEAAMILYNVVQKYGAR